MSTRAVLECGHQLYGAVFKSFVSLHPELDSRFPDPFSFQEIQGNSALTTSVKILPNVVTGIVTNFTTGYFVNKLPAMYAVLSTSILCAVSPLLMAVINPSWPYWYDAFFAQVSPLLLMSSCKRSHSVTNQA